MYQKKYFFFRWLGKDNRLTLRGDLTRANEVTLITNEDYWSLGLSLSQEKPKLRGTVEATPVSHRKHQDAHLTLQSRQVLNDKHRDRGWCIFVLCEI